jgi:hypothetical protein
MPLQTFLESQTFHLPVQIMLASLCYKYGVTKRRDALTLLTGSMLAAVGLIDFCVGVHLDFRHLPYSEAEALTTYLTELFKSYLLVNMFYRLWLDPYRFWFLSECLGPLAVYGFIDSSQRDGYPLHALRPLLIGLIPNVVAALQDTEEIPAYQIMWCRVALPMYALRFLYAPEQLWAGMFVWIMYNMSVLGYNLF